MKTPYERVMERTVWVGECLVFTGSRNQNGYGQVGRQKGVSHLAHRVVLEHHETPPEAGLCCLHSCDNPPCVNIEHLRWGTMADNVADMHARGRANKSHGERHVRAKLNEDDIRFCRAMYDTRQLGIAVLARHFDVDYATMKEVVNRSTWRHVT